MDQAQSSANPATKTIRTRTSSVQLVLNHVTHTPPDHRFAANNFDHSTNLTPPNSSPTQTKPQPKKSNPIPHWEQVSQGFWHDLRTMRWMRHPGQSSSINQLINPHLKKKKKKKKSHSVLNQVSYQAPPFV
jgi:hypothetical protein